MKKYYDLAQRIYDENRVKDCYPDDFDAWAEEVNLSKYIEEKDPEIVRLTEDDFMEISNDDDQTGMEYLEPATPGDWVWYDGEFLCSKDQVERYEEHELQMVKDCYIGSMEDLIVLKIVLHNFGE